MGVYSGTSRKKGIYSGGGTLGSPSSSSGPSVFSRIMDILSRGNYAAAGAVKGGMGPEGTRRGADQFSMDVPKGFWAGFSGKKKNSFQEIVPQVGITRGTNNRVAMGIEGFLYDVLLDPTNALGVGIAKAPAKTVAALKSTDKALDVADTAKDIAKTVKQAEDITKAVPDVAETVTTSERVVRGLKLEEQARKLEQTGKFDESEELFKIADDVAEEAASTLPTVGRGKWKILTAAESEGGSTVGKLPGPKRSIKPSDIDPKLKAAIETVQEIMKRAGQPVSYGKSTFLDDILESLAKVEPVLTKTGKLNQGATSAKIMAALRKIEKVQNAAKAAAVPPPAAEKLWSRAIPGVSVGIKTERGAKVLEALEKGAQPSLFGDDALDVGRATRTAPAPPQTIPKRPGPVVDTTPGLAGLTDMGAPISRALEIRLLGKGVVKSEKAYEGLAKLLRPIGATQPAQTLSASFRTAHGLLPEVHNLQRIYSGQGRQVVADKATEINKIFAGGDVAAGVKYPRVDKAGQKRIYEAIQAGTDEFGVRAVDLLPAELKIPAQYMQVELAKLSDLGRRTDDNLLDIDVPVTPESARNAKFEEIPQWRGAKKADGTPRTFDRAPQAFIAQYDRAVRKQYFEKFAQQVEKRFPEKSAEMMGNMKKAREVFGVDGDVSSSWKHYMDTVQSPWKRWVTQYRPGFHIRNMLGDTFNAYLAGTRAQRFIDAGKVLAYNMGKKIEGATVKMGRRSFGLDEIETLYRKAGLETSFIETEVIGASRRKIGHAITQGSQQREKYVRMATFIDSMDKALARSVSIEKATEEAAFRVRKFHFDYTDLTPFERKLRTFIPFYTYTRKELPLLLEQTLANPGKIVNTQKAGSALETMLGVESDPDNPFPGIEGLMPEYMRDQQFIQRGNNKVFTPGLPTDMLGMLGPRSFVKEQAGGMAPLIKGPLELASGKSFPLGYNLRKKDQSESEMLARYMAAYLPYGNFARDSKSPLSERLLNMLTGVGSKTVRG